MRSSELFPHNGAEAIPQSSFSLLKPSLHCACHNWFSGVYIQTGDEPGFDPSAPKGDVKKSLDIGNRSGGCCVCRLLVTVDNVTVVAITQVNMFCQNSCAVNNKKIYVF
ncbi:hypothetical protein XENOCAPTIV_021022 [Xenoophorus captivus]|uniref:Uncharacterized protein n=1 Tax=Xenoophorus captivus TaxID=1517983 RepID=A0ABV0RIP7_9TELE